MQPGHTGGIISPSDGPEISLWDGPVKKTALFSYTHAAFPSPHASYHSKPKKFTGYRVTTTANCRIRLKRTNTWEQGTNNRSLIL
jgi:hypothetical protein